MSHLGKIANYTICFSIYMSDNVRYKGGHELRFIFNKGLNKRGCAKLSADDVDDNLIIALDYDGLDLKILSSK